MRRTVLVGLVIAAASRAALAGPPVAEVSPGALSFPAVHAEHGSATLTLEITNAAAEGDDELVYAIAPHAIGDPVAFTVTTNGCPLFASCASLPGWTDTYTIAFHPQNNAVHDQPLVISTNDPAHPTIEVPLVARGDYPRLVIDEIGGEIPIGQVWTLPATPVGETTTATLTGRNASLVELHLWSTYTPGPDVEIVAGPTGERWLAPGEVVTWTLACTPPSIEGAFQDLTFDTNGNVNPSSLYVSCPGIGAALRAAPTVEFGVVPVDQDEYRRVRVVNAGNQATTLDEIRSADPRFAAVGVSLPTTLEPGGVLEFDLRFTPTESGPRSTTVTLRAGS
ncbi:MAG: choice-of-anchor D domain-containing protein, partial [Kofleriaceae bacterium]